MTNVKKRLYLTSILAFLPTKGLVKPGVSKNAKIAHINKLKLTKLLKNCNS